MSEPVRRMLLAVDGSRDSEHAARAAADLAGRTGAELHVVHAWQYIHSPHLQAYIRSELERWGREILEEQVKKIEAAGAGVAKAHLLMGRAASVILHVAGEIGADLIVMGSRGTNPIERLLLGSVSEEVVSHAGQPVLIMRGSSWPPRRVVIGDDGSGPAWQAAELGTRLARLFGAEEVLVRAHPRLPAPSGGWGPEAARGLAEARGREEEALRGRAEELGALLGSRPNAVLAEKEPAGAILDAAGEDEATLVALGSRGMGAVRRAMLGSVSTKVLRAARGPVLVCPGRERPQDGRGG
ncbi:UspA [Rubrobacter xylanophilus DSM 9941]|uniref:UspA n=1 Tax=Rubrobacter xylanophilus (strain DSM 9941 / JCM 11954 / NBRC 16129 / PRD-1) TaxID=266117 RepID=Q1ARK7_RUBXD|nr:universal stress protein [Rubrobacter xylanophilus]ABG05971.1 UspA [Rubrobacter xylanophilus DSM 9941]